VGRSNFKQFVNLWEFNSSYFTYLRNSQIFTGTDLNSSPEPYQPHSIPPIGGGHAITVAQKIQYRHHLALQRKLRNPNWKMRH